MVNVTIKSGVVSIRTPYDPKFVAELKAATRTRRWDPANKIWTVSVEEMENALAVVRQYWGDVEIEGQTKTQTQDDQPIDPARIEAIKSALPWAVYDHQAEAIARLEDGASILQMEMGTGKTRAILSYWHIHRNDFDHLLVVCPTAVIRSWQEEMKKLGLPEPRYLKNGKVRGPEGSRIVIANVEIFSRPNQALLGLIESLDLNKTLVVIDESHTIKSPKAKRTKNIVELLGGAKKRVVMTGTITTRDVSDLWQQVDFSVPGLLGDFWQFLRKHAVLRNNKWGGVDVVGVKNLDQLNRTLAPHRLIKTRDQCLSLPEAQDIWVSCDLTPDQLRALEDLERGILETPDGDTKIIANIWAKARQIVGGQVYYQDGEGDEVPRRVANYESGKVAALIDLLEEIEGRIVIMCEFGHEVDRVAEAIRGNTDRGVFQFEEIDDWRQDPDGALVMTAAKGGVGLNLQDASTMIFFSLGVNAALYEQAKARIYRAGQTRKCLFVHLVTDHWVEQSLREIMERKLNLHEALLGLKDRIKNKTGVAG